MRLNPVHARRKVSWSTRSYWKMNWNVVKRRCDTTEFLSRKQQNWIFPITRMEIENGCERAVFGKRILFLYWVVGGQHIAGQMMMRWEILYLYLLWCHALLLIMPLSHVREFCAAHEFLFSTYHKTDHQINNPRTENTYSTLMVHMHAEPIRGSHRTQCTMYRQSALHRAGMIWRNG